ncbi:MAG: response regulator [Bacteroidota bacterium]
MESRKIKILAIDDNPDNLISMKAVIREAFPDILVFTALTGRDGIALAQAEDPDVILLDIVMPGMDGYEVCQRLKSDKLLADTPVIFVTAIKGEKASRIRALNAGGDAFLAKPIDESELTAQIRAMLKIKAASSEKHAEKERLSALVSEKTYELQQINIATLNLLEDLQKENEARKKSEEALRKSEEKYRTIFENVQDIFYQTDLEGTVIEISPSIQYFSEFSREEIIGSPVSDLYADKKDREVLLTAIQRNGELRDYEVKLKTKTGVIKYVSINARLIYDAQKRPNHIDGALRDVTERKNAEKQIRLLSRAIEQSPVTIMITDKDGNIEYVNPKFTEVTGYSLDEVTGKNPNLLQSGAQTREFYRELWTTILSGNNWHGEFHNRKKNGESYWEDALISSMVNPEGVISHFIGVKMDITEKRKMMSDLTLAKEKAEESDRLKSAFLANMSHEIRTPMNGILGFAGLLKEPDLTGEEQQKYIRIIEKSGARMLNIINDIVSISKIESGQMDINMAETNINEQVEYTYTFFRPEAEQKGLKISYNNSLPAKNAVIKTDREKLYAILTNLVKNAIKFCDNGTIELGYTFKPAAPAGPAADGKGMVEFYVKDTGIGIPKGRQEAIFDRFVQADIGDTRAFQGAGLGLSISKAYVEMLGGRIRVESDEKKGAIFFFTIPYNGSLTPDNLAENLTDKAEKEITNRNLKILVAEDDEASEIYISLTVKMFGKDVIQAGTGVEAVEICRNNPDLDLILMDIKMPVMDGYEATRQIRKFNNGVVIIAQTAYGLTGDREKAIEAGCNDYLAKPIKKADLLRMITRFFSASPNKSPV